MKVLLVGNHPGDALESMERFALLMKRLLLERGCDARLVIPAARVGRTPSAQGRLAKWLGYVDKFLLFPRDLAHAVGWADVVHICDHSNAIYTRYVSTVPHVVTCHDLMAIRSALGEFPAHRTGWSGRCLQRTILSGLRRAARIACVSASTRADVLRIAGLPGERVSVISNALNHPYRPMERAEALRRAAALGIDAARHLILHVGGNQWYKNRPGVLRIYDGLRRRGIDAALVLAGKPWTVEMRRFIEERGFASSVVELTRPTNEDLRALYSLAHLLLFPSHCEGFGWPVIEAQACGCPVVTSDRPPMTQVSGGAALFIDPENPEGAAAAIAAKWHELESLRNPGLANAARFDAQSMIDAYLREYARALA